MTVEKVTPNWHFALLERILGHEVGVGIVYLPQEVVLVLQCLRRVRNEDELDSGIALEALEAEGLSNYLVYTIEQGIRQEAGAFCLGAALKIRQWDNIGCLRVLFERQLHALSGRWTPTSRCRSL